MSYLPPLGGSCKLGPRQRPHAAAFSGSLLQWGRVSDHTAALSGSSLKASGSAGGYLLQAVVNALVAYRLEQRRRMQLKLPLSYPPGARSRAPALQRRYSDGARCERTLLQAEQQYVTSTTNVSLNLVQSFKALGRRLGANLAELARYQEAWRDHLARAGTYLAENG
jgi:hypothetical protein